MLYYLHHVELFLFFFFFQAEDGIRDYKVTGVQTCALPISDITLLVIFMSFPKFCMTLFLSLPTSILATVQIGPYLLNFIGLFESFLIAIMICESRVGPTVVNTLNCPGKRPIDVKSPWSSSGLKFRVLFTRTATRFCL